LSSKKQQTNNYKFRGEALYDLSVRLEVIAMNNKNDLTELFGEVIYAYTREQALADGVLIDVSKMAKEAGITFPAAVTSAVWHEFIVPNTAMVEFGQDENGRCWDVLWMLWINIMRASKPSDVIYYQVSFFMEIDDMPKRKLIMLKAVCGPGDDGEPVITIMKPDED
jgi:hypothetical protein